MKHTVLLILLTVILVGAFFGATAAVGTAKFLFGIILFFLILIIGGIVLLVTWASAIDVCGGWVLGVLAMILTILYILALWWLWSHWIAGGFAILLNQIPEGGIF